MLLPRLVRAEEYPSRTVRLIVPYPPGGSTDITARVLGEKMGTDLLPYVMRTAADGE